MKLKTNNILIGLALGLTIVSIGMGVELIETKEEVATTQIKVGELQLQNKKLINNNKNLKGEVLELRGQVQDIVKRFEEHLVEEQNKAKSVQNPVSETPKKHVNIVATFYSALGEENGGYVGINALGGKLKQGSLSVPKDIPLGTKFYIEGYGDFVADDRGGAIKRIDANTIKVDIFIPRKSGESDNAYRKRVNNMGRIKTKGWYTTPS